MTYHVRIASSGWVESEEGIGTLSMQPFRATSGNRKWTVFLFTHQILSAFTARDDYFENPGERTFLAREMLTSGLRPWLENVACLSSLLSWVTDVSRTWPEVILTESQLTGSTAEWKDDVPPWFLRCLSLTTDLEARQGPALRRKKIPLSVFIRVPRLWWRNKEKKGYKPLGYPPRALVTGRVDQILWSNIIPGLTRLSIQLMLLPWYT